MGLVLYKSQIINKNVNIMENNNDTKENRGIFNQTIYGNLKTS